MYSIISRVRSPFISANGYLREHNFDLDKINNGQKRKFILLICYKNYIIENVSHIF
jgi:hypothetical protein